MSRYIDIDKFGKYINTSCDDVENCTKECYECYYNNGGAEDVAPVVHAKWKILENDYAYDDMFTYECSNCLSELCMTSDAFAPYCCNCGAKMDKGANL